jgi:glycosyltransferase involved in cell wall biosynthesis
VKIAVISNGAQSLLNFRGPLLAEMVRRGHEVLAFAPDHNDASRTALKELGCTPVDYRMSRAGSNPLQEFGVIVKLRALLVQHRPDLCFSYFIKPVIYGAIAARLAGVPRRYALIEGLGFAFTEGSEQNARRRLLQGVISALMRAVGNQLDLMIFLNPDDMGEFVDRKLIALDKAAFLGAIGVDLDDWPQTPFLPGPPTFLLAARLLQDKGIQEYVAAARSLRANFPDTRFLLLGGLDDNPAAITRSEVEGWVHEGLIEWPGHVKINPWLAQSHIFVLPSYYREGVPRGTQEAMAFGRPVITTDSPGCRETVLDGVNGYLVPPRDPVALAAAMQRFLDLPDLIIPFGRESRRLAEERFDVHKQNARLLSFMGL